MKRSELEKFLGKEVEVSTINYSTFKGVLHKTDEEKYKDKYEISTKKNYYFCEVENKRYVLFRSSHVKKIRRVNNEDKINTGNDEIL